MSRESGKRYAFALLILAYFLYFNWEGLWAHFGADDMMNMSKYWKLPPLHLLLDLLLPWRGAYRPVASLFYLPLFQVFGLNPVPYHAVMLAILLGNLYLTYLFARRVGCSELQSGLAALVVAYHAGLSMLYYDTAFIYDVLCFSFYLSAFLCYARVRAQGRLLRGGETAMVLGLYLCALNSKEMALTLPIVLLVYEWVYHRPAWTARKFAGWLLGPGRVMLYCAALNLVYLYGKAFGPDPMMQASGYYPEFSLRRLFSFEKAAMDDLFLSWGKFNWRGVVAVWLLTAFLAWRRPRPALRFCWLFLMLTPLPIALLEGRRAACLYIPLAAWAVFAAVVLTDVAAAAARFLSAEPIFRRAGYTALFAIFLGASIYFWAKQNDQYRRSFVRAAMADVGRETALTLDKIRALNPRVKRASHVVFLNDPFDGWDMVFIGELWFRDRTLQFHLQRKTPLPPEELAKMTVFDFQDGRLVPVTVLPPLTGGGSPRP